MNNLKLKEIIWEVTLKCNKNCKYCGSKAFLDHNPNYQPEEIENIYKIAKNIATYPPEEINFSGGEPGTLSRTNIIELINIFKDKSKVKVVTNGLILKNEYYGNDFAWSAIGLSINHLSDFDGLTEHIKKNLNIITVITNFGTHNAFELDVISDRLIGLGIKCWQVQLTEGELALNKEGIKYIYDKLTPMMTTIGVQVAIADNLQKQHDCHAGLSSCGILANGSVIACLSQRSYEKSIIVYGNLLTNNLKTIWEEGFKDRRFDDKCKTCRSCFDYPWKDEDLSKNVFKLPKRDAYLYGGQRQYPMITPVYGCTIPNDNWRWNKITVYGVQIPNQVVMYAVQIPPSGTPPLKTWITSSSTIMKSEIDDYDEDAASKFAAELLLGMALDKKNNNSENK